MQDMTDPEVLYVDAHEGEPMQFESLCMECMENVSSSLGLSFVFVHGQDCKFDLVCELVYVYIKCDAGHDDHGPYQDSTLPRGRCLLLRVRSLWQQVQSLNTA